MLNLVQHTVERTTPPARRIELGAQSMPMLVGGSRPLVQGCFLVKEKRNILLLRLFIPTNAGGEQKSELAPVKGST